MIALRQLSKRFGDRLALAPLDLEVRAGETVALVGPNGAGKSTLLRLLAGIIQPTSGTATIAGRAGYLPQRLGLPPQTRLADLAALVAGARGVAPAAALAALAEAGLAERSGATLAELSGGQRQRAILALAALGTVDALLLDEPSISLDADGAEEVREAIRAARRRGAAVLFASHHLHDVALLADRIVLMIDGRVVAHGSIGELAAAAGIPWTADDNDPPIERIYRVLVRRSRSGAVELRLVRGDAA